MPDPEPDDRGPLDATAVQAALAGGAWREVIVVERTGSTNADLAARARDGASGGVVLVAEEQTAGRGRLDRQWQAPSRSALTFSALIRPSGVLAAAWGWLPLLAGLAAADGVGASGLTTSLKWPNDVLVADRKVAGVLVERVDTPGGAMAVVGVGINVSLTDDELPVREATSIRVAGGEACREPILVAALRSLAGWHERWAEAGGDAEASGVAAAYREACFTIGRWVRALLPGGGVIAGRATGLDATGRLVVATADGERVVGAGDVVHLR